MIDAILLITAAVYALSLYQLITIQKAINECNKTIDEIKNSNDVANGILTRQGVIYGQFRTSKKNDS